MMELKPGDIVVDYYGKCGVVVCADRYRPEDLILIVKTGDCCFGTLQSNKKHWKKVAHSKKFIDVLNTL